MILVVLIMEAHTHVQLHTHCVCDQSASTVGVCDLLWNDTRAAALVEMGRHFCEPVRLYRCHVRHEGLVGEDQLAGVEISIHTERKQTKIRT